MSDHLWDFSDAPRKIKTHVNNDTDNLIEKLRNFYSHKNLHRDFFFYGFIFLFGLENLGKTFLVRDYLVTDCFVFVKGI